MHKVNEKNDRNYSIFLKNTHSNSQHGENPNFVGLLDYYLKVLYYFTLGHLWETGVGGRTRILLVLGLLSVLFACLSFFFL